MTCLLMTLGDFCFGQCADWSPGLSDLLEKDLSIVGSYRLVGKPLESKVTHFVEKYGPGVNTLEDSNHSSKNCVSEFTFHFRNQADETIEAVCLVAVGLRGASIATYRLGYCEKATLDKNLASRLNAVSKTSL